MLDLARHGNTIAAAAITGSLATGGADRWSDIDLLFGVDDEVAMSAAVEDWTSSLYRTFDAVHHFDLAAPPAVYRAFLLRSCLEVDIGFTPAARFGPFGAHFRPVFGTSLPVAPAPAVLPPAPGDVDHAIGRGWHHVLHARSAIERSRAQQADHWIRALQEQVALLARLRLGREVEQPGDGPPPGRHADELRGSLTVAATEFLDEVGRARQDLASELDPVLRDALVIPRRPTG